MMTNETKKPRVKYRSWHEKAKFLRSAGLKLIDIAEKCGVSQQAVSVVVRDIKCPVDHITPAVTRNLMQYHEDVKAGRKPPPPPYRGKWTGEQVAKITRLYYEMGLTTSQIAERFNTSKNAICGLLHRQRQKMNDER